MAMGNGHWASFINMSYDTSYGVQAGYHARYYCWDDSSKKYICKRSSVPFGYAYLDLDAIYHATLRNLNAAVSNDSLSKLMNILKDQLMLAINGKPSVFSLGFYPMSNLPFSDTNLLWKNLSSEEVFVIRDNLTPNQYIECFMVYYNTYKMAIQIAADDERNAKRHVFWQISMAKAFGENFACAIGAAHEKGRPGSIEDNIADEYNNRVALDYWKLNPEVPSLDAANKLWDIKALKKVEIQRLKDEL